MKHQILMSWAQASHPWLSNLSSYLHARTHPLSLNMDVYKQLHFLAYVVAMPMLLHHSIYSSQIYSIFAIPLCNIISLPIIKNIFSRFSWTQCSSYNYCSFFDPVNSIKYFNSHIYIISDINTNNENNYT